MQKKNDSDFILNITYKPWLVSSILLVFDILAITVSFYFAIEIRIGLIPLVGGEIDLFIIAQIFWMSIILIIGLFVINGLYPGVGRTGVVELKEILKINATSFVILGLAIFVLGFGNQFSRWIFIIAWLLSSLLISITRLMIHNRGSLFSWWGEPILVVGYQKDVAKIITSLKRARRMALKPVIVLILDKNCQSSNIFGIPSFPYSLSLQSNIKNWGVHQALFVSHSIDLMPSQKKQLYSLSLSFSKLVYVMGDSPLSSLSMKPIDLEGRPGLRVQYNLLDPWSNHIKRITELVICLVTLAITFPLFVLIAILIRFDSKGPIIFNQKRMGKGGCGFDLYKFRTMELDAENKLQIVLENNEELKSEYHKFHKIKNDPRITCVGRFLRKISLDELPQIWNVIQGDMSLIGPRAYLPQELKQMGGSADLIHRVRPGLTGWWQVMGRHELTFIERLRFDEYYISNFSLWMDFYILIKTVWVVISGTGK